MREGSQESADAYEDWEGEPGFKKDLIPNDDIPFGLHAHLDDSNDHQDIPSYDWELRTLRNRYRR